MMDTSNSRASSLVASKENSKSPTPAPCEKIAKAEGENNLNREQSIVSNDFDSGIEGMEVDDNGGSSQSNGGGNSEKRKRTSRYCNNFSFLEIVFHCCHVLFSVQYPR